ncbi:phosphate ABC transporter substrate-binding protein [Veronia nyctiphanis]|uniref:Phosphate-binding protein n=1 Tax=Veronia nyctiphanis TaxID=1278244 RepID=A0A4Q0YQ75_9GAMM|nr:phosphate ABC transporter substrate-binding protein [Veronia nyctiphanis]RXJ73156.1 phosphate ABC transporter substrate-binding protein [Veronia nyctiphanis]
MLKSVAFTLTVAAVVFSTAVFAHHKDEYQRVQGLYGNLSIVGSDTLSNLVINWSSAFERHYPNVNVQIQASGSSTAAPALIESTAQLGTMSRPMRTGEREAFEERYGYPPVELKVAIDAMAIYVHQDNPITGLSLAQVDAMFSETLRCGKNRKYESWGELGMTGSWQRRDIQRFGRNSVSGTYGYFKSRALCRGDFRNDVNEQPGSSSVVESVASSLGAIGYAGAGYKTAGVRMVPLAKNRGDKFVPAGTQHVTSGEYPLARYLYIYLNKVPGKPLPPVEAEFLRLVFSAGGQALVRQDGLVALPDALIHQQLDELGLEKRTD